MARTVFGEKPKALHEVRHPSSPLLLRSLLILVLAHQLDCDRGFFSGQPLDYFVSVKRRKPALQKTFPQLFSVVMASMS
jgi:hypothetical protein